MLIHLAMRRFLCMNAACAKVTFAGQADGLTARYQRWSVPLAGLLSQIALELAGRAGTRLAGALGIAVHRGTLLQLLTGLPEPAVCRRRRCWVLMTSRCAAGTFGKVSRHHLIPVIESAYIPVIEPACGAAGEAALPAVVDR